MNEKLEDECELVNQDSEGDGWMVELKLTRENPEEIDGLMTKEEYMETLP